MKTLRPFVAACLLCMYAAVAYGQTSSEKYIEVTGTSEVTIVPDEIHYIVEIKEYWEEEFDGKSKPEEFRTKVPLAVIENDLRQVLHKTGIPDHAIRTQEIGDRWRERGKEFCIAKRFDITLSDFEQINKIIHAVDTKGINSMYVGELKNKDMQSYRRQGKIEALKAAQTKAAYLLEAMGKQPGEVLLVVEPEDDRFPSAPYYRAQSNVSSSQADSFDAFQTIKLRYSMRVRFEIQNR